MPDEDGHGAHGKKKDKDGKGKDGEKKGEHDGHGSGAGDGSGGGDGAGGEKSGEKKKSDAPAAGQAKVVPVLLDLGNTSCPVMGGDADGKTYTEWNGLRVGHCCAGCNKRFLKNPESLLDEVSPKWRAAAAAAKAIDAAKGDERKALLAKTAKSWTVVRQPVGNAPKAPTAPAGLLVDLGNEACPVMGGDVNGKTFTEWNGLRVGHCCPGCSKRFLANPEALLDEVAPKWRDAAKAIVAVNSAKGAARKTALTKLQKTWKVVREPAAETAPKTDSDRTK